MFFSFVSSDLLHHRGRLFSERRQRCYVLCRIPHAVFCGLRCFFHDLCGWLYQRADGQKACAEEVRGCTDFVWQCTSLFFCLCSGNLCYFLFRVRHSGEGGSWQCAVCTDSASIYAGAGAASFSGSHEGIPSRHREKTRCPVSALASHGFLCYVRAGFRSDRSAQRKQGCCYFKK